MSAYYNTFSGLPEALTYPLLNPQAQPGSELIDLSSMHLRNSEFNTANPNHKADGDRDDGRTNSTNTSAAATMFPIPTIVDYSERCPICMKEQFILTQNPELSKENSVMDFMENLESCVNNLLGTKRLCNDPGCHSYATIIRLCNVLERLEKTFADLSIHITDNFLPFENDQDVETAELQLQPEFDLEDSPGADYNDQDDSNSGLLREPEPELQAKKCKKRTKNNINPRKKVRNKQPPTSSPATSIVTQGNFTETQIQSLAHGPPFVCPESNCGKSFKQRHYLSSHLLLHTNEKPFACPKCDKTFRHNPALFLHLRRHDGIKPYKCPEPNCTYAVDTKYHLNMHIKQVHKRIRDILCSYCPKTFSLNGALTNHCRMAHPEKSKNAVSFSCELCGSSFAAIRRLKDHITNKHKPEEKQFICDECGKGFLTISLCRRHKREVHLKQRRPRIFKYECQKSDCDKKFVTKQNFDSHQLAHERRETKEKALALAPKLDKDAGLAPSQSLLSNITQGQLSIDKILYDTSDKPAPSPKRQQRLPSLISKSRKKKSSKSKRNTSNSKSKSQSAQTLSPEEKEAIISCIMSGQAKEIQIKLERLVLEEEDVKIKEELLLEDEDLKI